MAAIPVIVLVYIWYCCVFICQNFDISEVLLALEEPGSAHFPGEEQWRQSTKIVVLVN